MSPKCARAREIDLTPVRSAVWKASEQVAAADHGDDRPRGLADEPETPDCRRGRISEGVHRLGERRCPRRHRAMAWVELIGRHDARPVQPRSALPGPA